MLTEIIKILAIPFLGTALGACCVFLVKKNLNPLFQKSMNGFAAGIMIAASVWSLIIPAIELAAANTATPFIPAAIGLWLGIIFFFLTDKLLYLKTYTSENAENPHKQLLPLLAVAIHNVPEGMALGVAFAAWLSGNEIITYSAIFALALGIGVQNFPEGSIISVPLYVSGKGRIRSFMLGIVSAIAETLGTVVTLLAASFILPLLPYLLCFAAGAMIYVVIGELCPEMSENGTSHVAILMFAVGFSLMMVLDVALG